MLDISCGQKKIIECKYKIPPESRNLNYIFYRVKIAFCKETMSGQNRNPVSLK